MSLSGKKSALDKAISEARRVFEKLSEESTSEERYVRMVKDFDRLRQEASTALQDYLITPPDPDPRLATIPVGVHIGSKGCADRYRSVSLADGMRDKPQSCLCGPGKCWVTYARNQHENDLPALTMEQWTQAGMPDPLPGKWEKPNKEKSIFKARQKLKAKKK